MIKVWYVKYVVWGKFGEDVSLESKEIVKSNNIDGWWENLIKFNEPLPVIKLGTEYLGEEDE